MIGGSLIFGLIYTLVSVLWGFRARPLIGGLDKVDKAPSAGPLMAVPSIMGPFFWKGSTAAGALGNMIEGAILVLTLQVSGSKPLGPWPGV